MTLSPLRCELLLAGGLATRLPRELRAVLIACASTIVIGVIAGSTFEMQFMSLSRGARFVWLTAYLFNAQDRTWLISVAFLLLALAFVPLPTLTSRPPSFVVRRPVAVPITLAFCVLIAGIVGTSVVFHGYHLSRDEFLAEFDSVVYRSGQMAAPIDAGLQAFASALEPRFMLPLPPNVGFISDYLPVNAIFRALVGSIADSNWTSPFLGAGAVLAAFGVARSLWPTRPDAAVIVTLLVATSSQVLVTAMTSYAMTAHLALNMIWLWFFLRDDRIGHAGAITTGFLASGLHQLIFHPLFAAPFILRLWDSKRRSLALLYVGSYAAICAFWIFYWKLILVSWGATPEVSTDTGPLYFLVRVVWLVDDFRWTGVELTLQNLLRFVVWQSPALIPLAALAYSAIRRGAGITRELASGILLTLIAMFILLPYQGHGWGYRYLHGLIGSAALLAGYGWIALTERARQDQIAASRTMLAICTAVALFVLLPVHAKQAYDFVAPYARASEAIEHAPTDVVIVDESRLLFAEDLVRNDPFLRNRPKVLDLTYLTEADIAQLCSHYTVSLFDYGQAVTLGIAANDQATKFGDAARAKSRQLMAQLACDTEPVVRAADKTR